MNSEKVIKCCKCGELAHKIMVIQNRGYGSMFDCFMENTFIPVCPECSKELNEEWFYEAPTVDGYCETYDNEIKIMDFINSTVDGNMIH